MNAYAVSARLKRIGNSPEVVELFDSLADDETRAELERRAAQDAADPWSNGEAVPRYRVRTCLKAILAAAGWTYHGNQTGRHPPYLAYTDTTGTDWKIYDKRLCFVPRGRADGYTFASLENVLAFTRLQTQRFSETTDESDFF